MIKLDNPHTLKGRTYCESVVVYMQTGTKNPLVIISSTGDKNLHVIDGIVDSGYDTKSLSFIDNGFITELIGFKNKIEVIVTRAESGNAVTGTKNSRVADWKPPKKTR